MKLPEFIEHFDPYFISVIEQNIERDSVITDVKENVALMKHALELTRTGKRVRPYLCFLSYLSRGGTSFEDIKDVCVALELIHLFALIHDDVMDESTFRRGVPTIHTEYENLTDHNTSARSSESQAILIGDLAYTWALELASDHFAKHPNDKARKAIFTLLREVIHGQMIDIVVSDAESVTTEELREKNHLKTSSYTFIRPMNIGCLLADPTESCDSFVLAGKHLGEAFQVIDDVIDIAGNSKTTNKDVCLDVEMAQHTLISNYIKDNAEQELRERFFSYFGKKLSEEDKAIVQGLAIESGAIENSKEHAAHEIDAGLTILSDVINPALLNTWQELGAMLKKRMY